MSFPRRMLRTASVGLVVAAAAAGPAGAQDAEAFFRLDARDTLAVSPVLRPVSAPTTSMEVPRPDSGSDLAVSPAAAVVGGIAGLVAGYYAGWYLGGSLENAVGPWDRDDPGLTGASLGALVGPIVGAAVGAHILDGRRGKLGGALAGSFLGGLLGAGAWAMASEKGGPYVAVGAVVLGAVIGEVQTRRR